MNAHTSVDGQIEFHMRRINDITKEIDRLLIERATATSIITNLNAQQRRQLPDSAQFAPSLAMIFESMLDSGANDELQRGATQEQIAAACTRTQFGLIDGPINTQCGISQADFDDDTRVTKLNTCGHVFTEGVIETWLAQNATCPMCRVDIRAGGARSAAPPAAAPPRQRSRHIRVTRPEIRITRPNSDSAQGNDISAAELLTHIFNSSEL